METEVKIMKLFWTFFWTFLLVNMATYVVSSMQGNMYDFTTAALLAVIATAIIVVIAAVIPDEPVEHH
jgi:CHASE2 domain-containing sensor protein